VEGVDRQKISSFFIGQFLIQPIILFLFVLIFLLFERILSENAGVNVEAYQFLPETVVKYLCLSQLHRLHLIVN
jgi:hypothetical protein